MQRPPPGGRLLSLSRNSHVHAHDPQEIVSELDKHIVGQDDAKRAVAIALRNRWRRQQCRSRCARRSRRRTS